MKTCDLCGRTSTGDDDVLTWSTAIEDGRAKTYCPDCTRAYLRSAEARLDSAWW